MGKLTRPLFDFSSLVMMVLLVPCGALAAPLVPMGQVTHVGTGEGGRAAVFSDGGFVVVWNAPNTLRARLFDRDAVATSGEIALVRPAGQVLTSVATLPRGFVVVWDQANAGGLVSVFARVFDRSGAPVSRPFKVHENSQYHRNEGFVAATPDGGFAVACNAANDPKVGFLSRFFDPTGVPLGPSATPFDGVAGLFGMAVGQDGVLTALFDGGEDSSFLVWERRDQAGSILGENTFEESRPDDQVGFAPFFSGFSFLPDGGFRIAWPSFGGQVSSIYAQTFDSAGQAALDATPVKVSGRPGWASNPLLAALPDGGFLAIYSQSDLGRPHQRSSGDVTGVGPLFVRSFNADETPATRPLRLSREFAGDQLGTALAVGPHGEAVAVWFEADPDPTKPGHVVARALRALE
ncbi:MAG TPA: hypothetical protein VHR45_23995 [Thermoanaerobaculia bacterium]|nr:hypothetical protein [Thermoanaerobaculia bacterium]